MEKIIQVLFDTEASAFSGLKAIQNLSANQDISLGESYVLSKNEAGQVNIRSAKDESAGYSTIGGGIVGGLIGLLAGPLGLLVGIGAGMIAGSAGDTLRAEQVSDYLDDVSVNIPPGKALLVAHVWEDWEIPVNTVLEPFSGQIHRLDIQEDVFVPAEKQLNQLSDEISRAEAAYLAADDSGKSALNQELLDLKIKREKYKEQLQGTSGHQEAQYNEWLKTERKSQDETNYTSETWEEKQGRLSARINAQQNKLNEILKNR